MSLFEGCDAADGRVNTTSVYVYMHILPVNIAVTNESKEVVFV